MDIKEILQRRSPAYYSEYEMIFAIESYIIKFKNIDVKINLMKNFPDLNNLNPFGVFQLQKEYKNLMRAFEIVQNNYYNDIKNKY